MELYPLIMAPCFVGGSNTPWGGTMLRDVFLKDAPDEITGASLEVSALPGQESLVAAGPHAGKPLTRMAELWGRDLTGDIDGEFPLLLKLLDARTSQPVEESATDHSKGWVILNAEPGAKLLCGGDLQQTARPGDVCYIPAGTPHALGAGIQAYEIQSTAAGSDVGPGLAKNEGTTVLCKGGSRTYYISDSHIELCRLNLSGKMPLESGRMLLLTALAPCRLHWGDVAEDFFPFTTCVVPAALTDVWLEGDARVLMSSLPDQEELRRELGYRAENVAGL